MMVDGLTGRIIGAAIKVHRALGPGLLETAYRSCLAFELRRSGLDVEEEVQVPVIYEGFRVECGFRADLIVSRSVIVECKTKSQLHPVDKAQLLSHLRLLTLQVGLLINFHEIMLKNGIHRIVNQYSPVDDDRPSSTSLHQ